MWTGSHCVCSSLGLFVISAKPKPEPLYGNGFWLGVLWLQMQTVFILNYYKRLERHASTLIFFLLWDALPHAFDAVPFQRKTRHEFNIATVYLGYGSCSFQMQKISCGHVAQNNLTVQSCFNTSLCGSSQRTSQHFLKTNSRINIKHLCVAPSLRFHGTWKQLFTIFFYQSSLKKLWRFLRTVQACGVWFGGVVCDTSHCLGSHWSLFVRSFIFFLSGYSSVLPDSLVSLHHGEESDSPLRGWRFPLSSNRSNARFHLCKMSAEILKALWMCCFQ